MRKQQEARPAVALHTIPGTAAHLGCSENHVYRLIAAGELGTVDIAPVGSERTKMRIRDDELAGYINQRTCRRKETQHLVAS